MGPPVRRSRGPLLISALVILACILMALLETHLQPSYPVKSVLRICIFLPTAGFYSLLSGDDTLLASFHPPEKRELELSLLLAISACCVILAGYALLAPWLDLSDIPASVAREGITRQGFLVVALYISFCNSLLEEFFFRGFAFLTLRQTLPGPFPWLFSSLAFALYHVSILEGRVAPPLFLLMIQALVLSGLLLAWLDRHGSIWCGWLVHAAANLALNLIGLHLFGAL